MDQTRRSCDLIDRGMIMGYGADMTTSGLPRSVRKFLRQEKARIRRDIFDSAEAQKRTTELVRKTRERYDKSKKRSSA